MERLSAFLMTFGVIFVLASSSFADAVWNFVGDGSISSSSNTGVVARGLSGYIEAGNLAYTLGNNTQLSFTISAVPHKSSYLNVSISGTNSDGVVGTNSYSLGALINGSYTINLVSDAVGNAGLTSGATFNSIRFYPFETSQLSATPLSRSVYESGENANASFMAANQKVTIRDLSVVGSSTTLNEADIPEPATFAYGAMGLLSILGLKRKLF